MIPIDIPAAFFVQMDKLTLMRIAFRWKPGGELQVVHSPLRFSPTPAPTLNRAPELSAFALALLTFWKAVPLLPKGAISPVCYHL